ncbi:zinc finger CCCH-type with G patch domain-containing protein [Cloeon dipterum]|uniref:zinc finger CCCH-type with G patch domain-containing protein n=1 Tax=Cloeon dipterum TaxID=197152 RepID=UPI00321F6595
MADPSAVYRQQLEQVENALALSTDEATRAQLQELAANLKELIGLTELENKEKHDAKEKQDAEWMLFQSEVGSGWSEGDKCRAPFPTCTGLHNAMISRLTVEEDCATVVFVQPLVQQMRMCPHHLNDRCRFENRCKYSHGQKVPLAQLQPFLEPDFGIVTIGAVVLAAGEDKLWRRAKVTEVETSSVCHLSFEQSGVETQAPMANVWPLEAASESLEDSSSDDEDSDDEMARVHASVVQRVLNVGCANELGAWERHTRGIGSKLMASMGYVTGAGLGRRQEGRVEPVEATVLPAGKSLDECMRLKEEAGDDDLFSAERRERKLERRRLKREQHKAVAAEKKRSSGDMFSFLNRHLVSESKKPEVSVAEGLATELNVRGFQLEERIKRAAKEEAHLAQAASRGVGQAVAKKLEAKRQELELLKREEKRVKGEQTRREERKKMSVF